VASWCNVSFTLCDEAAQVFVQSAALVN
jgi:hypothetical protein